MTSQRLNSFFSKGGSLWGWMGGDAPRGGRPARVVALAMGFAALLAVPQTGHAAKAAKPDSQPPLAPIFVPPAPPPRPSYTQDQLNQWYFEGWTQSANHPTQFSGFIAEMNARFGAIDPDRMILILDPDMIYGANAIASSYGNAHQNLRGNMNSYVWRKGRLLMVHDGLDVLNQILIRRGGVAIHSDEIGQFIHARSKTKAACVIAPQNPDASGLRIAGNIASLDTTALGRFSGVSAADAFPADLMQRWTVYHEAGHCQDDVFLRDAIQNPQERTGKLVAAETFSDVYSALLLASEGHTKFAGQLARLRALTPGVAGRRIAGMCTPEGRWPLHLYNQTLGALSHYSEPALEATQAYVDSVGQAGLRKLSHDQLIEKAVEITRAKSYSHDDVMVLRGYLLSGPAFMEHLTERAKAGAPDDVRRLAVVNDFIRRADRATAENTVAENLSKPVFPNYTDESPFMREWESFVGRVAKRGATMEALAEEYTATRDRLRGEIAAGQGDVETKSIVLTQIMVRLLTGDDMINDLLHGRKLPDAAKPLWKQPAQPAPYVATACPMTKENFDKMMGELDALKKPPAPIVAKPAAGARIQ